MPDAPLPPAQLVAQRARGDLIDRGWPEFLHWMPDPDTLAVLEELTAARQAAQDYPWRAVTDPPPPEVRTTLLALIAGLHKAGLPRQLAEFAADATLLRHLDVVGAVRWTALPKPPGWMP